MRLHRVLGTAVVVIIGAATGALLAGMALIARRVSEPRSGEGPGQR